MTDTAGSGRDPRRPPKGGARRPDDAWSRAYVWGYNNTGELGLGHGARVFHPTPASFPQRFVDIQGGTNFTVALTSSGAVWSWGGNEHGQLGDGTRQPRMGPRRVVLPGKARISAISVGADHVLALSTQGQVFAWGRNHRGQLGLNDQHERLTPQRVTASSIRSIATGDAVSAAVTTHGDLLVWGRNGAGQLPLRNASTRGSNVLAPTRSTVIPARVAIVDAGLRHLVVLTESGTVLAYGTDSAGRRLTTRVPMKPSWGRVKTISAGEDHTLALTDRGIVVGWGNNTLGQTGPAEQAQVHAPMAVSLPGARGRATAIRAGHRHSLVLTDRHEVFSWGDSTYGAVGTGRRAREDRAVTTPQKVDLRGAATTRLAGGGYNSVVFVQTGPGVALRLTPADTAVRLGSRVRFRVRVVDAFGTDLGTPARPVVLTAPGAHVAGSTVNYSSIGTYPVSARAGALVGRTTIRVTKGE